MIIGYDIGSSFIKVALVEAATGKTLGVVQYPAAPMEIVAKQADWAEQSPAMWWENVCLATQKLLAKTEVSPTAIKGIGIAYQMHGLVVVDKTKEVLRPAIIWCDSRAVNIGQQAFMEIGEEQCLSHLLNSPANFTASKLKWVQENEPDIYAKIDKILLPGDYIALKMTDEACTTIQGLSEGMLWDFRAHEPAQFLLDYYQFDPALIPKYAGAIGKQGQLTPDAAEAMGLVAGIPVTYRAGDQPNNALSLNVLQPGEVAATGGTSGVVFGVNDRTIIDEKGLVNAFAHVNHTKKQSRIGTLLCINGAGIQYSWLRQLLTTDGISYDEMEKQASTIPIHSDGLHILPFGNGAERMLSNKNVKAHILNIQFNRHRRAHFYRAALEGIAFSFVYGMEVMKNNEHEVKTMRVGNDNLFQSTIFAETIVHLMNCKIEIFDTTGAIGAAKAAGVAIGLYASIEEAMGTTLPIKIYEPNREEGAYRAAFSALKEDLKA